MRIFSSEAMKYDSFTFLRDGLLLTCGEGVEDILVYLMEF